MGGLLREDVRAILSRVYYEQFRIVRFRGGDDIDNLDVAVTRVAKEIAEYMNKTHHVGFELALRLGLLRSPYVDPCILEHIKAKDSAVKAKVLDVLSRMSSTERTPVLQQILYSLLLHLEYLSEILCYLVSEMLAFVTQKRDEHETLGISPMSFPKDGNALLLLLDDVKRTGRMYDSYQRECHMMLSQTDLRKLHGTIRYSIQEGAVGSPDSPRIREPTRPKRRRRRRSKSQTERRCVSMVDKHQLNINRNKSTEDLATHVPGIISTGTPPEPSLFMTHCVSEGRIESGKSSVQSHDSVDRPPRAGLLAPCFTRRPIIGAHSLAVDSMPPPSVGSSNSISPREHGTEDDGIRPKRASSLALTRVTLEHAYQSSSSLSEPEKAVMRNSPRSRYDDIIPQDQEAEDEKKYTLSADIAMHWASMEDQYEKTGSLSKTPGMPLKFLTTSSACRILVSTYFILVGNLSTIYESVLTEGDRCINMPLYLPSVLPYVYERLGSLTKHVDDYVIENRLQPTETHRRVLRRLILSRVMLEMMSEKSKRILSLYRRAKHASLAAIPAAWEAGIDAISRWTLFLPVNDGFAIYSDIDSLCDGMAGVLKDALANVKSLSSASPSDPGPTWASATQPVALSPILDQCRSRNVSISNARQPRIFSTPYQ